MNVCSVSQLCLTLCDPVDCSLPDSPVHGIFPARILEWVAISSSRRQSWPRDETQVSCGDSIGKRILYHWATWQATEFSEKLQIRVNRGTSLVVQWVRLYASTSGGIVQSLECSPPHQKNILFHPSRSFYRIASKIINNMKKKRVNGVETESPSAFPTPLPSPILLCSGNHHLKLGGCSPALFCPIHITCHIITTF